MPVSVHLLTRPGAASRISIGMYGIERETVLSIDSRDDPQPFTEARRVAFVIAEVDRSLYAMTDYSKPSSYDGATVLDRRSLDDLLQKTGRKAADDEVRVTAWQVLGDCGKRYVAVLPDIMAERDVVTVMNSLGVRTSKLDRVSVGSFPVVDLDRVGAVPRLLAA